MVRISPSENEFDPQFLEKIHFARDLETRRHDNKVEKMRNIKSKVENTKTIKKGKDVSGSQKTTVDKEICIQDEIDKDELVDSDTWNNENLTCLYSPNWLTDLVINRYLDILKSKDDSVFTYSSFFYPAFTSGGFERVKTYYRRENLLSHRILFMPIHHGNHWFLVTYDGSRLTSYDPYDYPGCSRRKKTELLKENLSFHKTLLMNLRNDYFKPLFSHYHKEYNEPSIHVKLPPEIPSQDNSHDCGPFLLYFAKYIMMKKDFDFGTNDMVSIRENIRKEIQTETLIDILPRKRRILPKPPRGQKRQKNMVLIDNQRRFMNRDNETCWLNSCLQLILTALDYENDVCQYGSTLWKQLVGLHNEGSSKTLLPDGVKNTIIETERNRPTTLNSRLRLFGLETVLDSFGRPIKKNRIGQQDSKDLFLCLDENMNDWPDVFNFFKVSTITSTTCGSCGYVSQQEREDTDTTSIMLSCPISSTNLKTFIEDEMNSVEKVNGWKDQNGCGQITTGNVRKRICNIMNKKYLIFILRRLIRIGDELEIIDTEVKINDDLITIKDNVGVTADFSVRGVIHHHGNAEGLSTFGHYMADVFNRSKDCWFRTSDDSPPQRLSIDDISSKGYIYLLQNVSTSF